jgi:hypothetical protein
MLRIGYNSVPKDGEAMANWYGETCSCGRILNKMHCSACGSTNLHGLAKWAIHIIQDANGNPAEKKFKSYRCRKCAEVSDEYVTLNYCQAPKLELLNTRQPKVVAPRNTETRQDLIDEVLRMSGMNPRQKVSPDKPIRVMEQTEDGSVIRRNIHETPVDYVDPLFGDNGKPKEDIK